MRAEANLFLALLVAASVASGGGHVEEPDMQLDLALSVKTMDKITRLQTPVSLYIKALLISIIHVV